MRTILLAAATGIAAFTSIAAAAGDHDYAQGGPPGGYGAYYGNGDGQSDGWDVSPVPLNVPGEAPAPRRWDAEHDHYPVFDGRKREYQRGYARLERGYAMPRFWMDPTYRVADWQFYGLSRPRYDGRWIRYYDEAVLVDGSGRVLDTVDLDWDHPMAGETYPERTIVSEQRYGGMAPGSYYAPPAVTATRFPVMPPPPVAWSAPPPPVTWTPAASTVIVQSAPAVTTTTTTTTTTYVEEVAAARRSEPRRAWHRPVRHAVTCCCLCTR